jgi:cytochrome c1
MDKPIPEAVRALLADWRDQAKRLRNEVPNLRDGTDKRFATACDADRAADELTAALTAAQQQGGADLGEVVCLACGDPIMPMGQLCHACSHPVSAPPSAPVGVKRWPFVESPGAFTERLAAAMQELPLIGAVRHVLIENPPALAQQPAAVDGVCAWAVDVDSEAWDGACGAKWQFTDGGPVENDMRHCPQCGKRVATQHQEPTT